MKRLILPHWQVLYRQLLLGFAIATLVTSMAVCAAQADGFHPFDSKSRQGIEQTLAGKPFILAFWSVDCAYCAEDLLALGELVRAQPAITLVTVSTDKPERTQQAEAVLDGLQLPVHERWQFAEPDEERLRYRIDKTWYGELPRTYFYDSNHRVQAISGRPDTRWLKAWLKRSLH